MKSSRRALVVRESQDTRKSREEWSEKLGFHCRLGPRGSATIGTVASIV